MCVLHLSSWICLTHHRTRLPFARAMHSRMNAANLRRGLRRLRTSGSPSSPATDAGLGKPQCPYHAALGRLLRVPRRRQKNSYRSSGWPTSFGEAALRTCILVDRYHPSPSPSGHPSVYAANRRNFLFRSSEWPMAVSLPSQCSSELTTIIPKLTGTSVNSQSSSSNAGCRDHE